MRVYCVCVRVSERDLCHNLTACACVHRSVYAVECEFQSALRRLWRTRSLRRATPNSSHITKTHTRTHSHPGSMLLLCARRAQVRVRCPMTRCDMFADAHDINALLRQRSHIVLCVSARNPPAHSYLTHVVCVAIMMVLLCLFGVT